MNLKDEILLLPLRKHGLALKGIPKNMSNGILALFVVEASGGTMDPPLFQVI